MNRESLFYIPCLCGAEVRSHEREAACPTCGRELKVEWEKPEEEAAPRERKPA